MAHENTLSFYYDTLVSSRPGTVYSMPSQAGVPAWVDVVGDGNMTTTKVIFDASFKGYCPASTSKWFARYAVLKELVGLENLNTSEVTDMDSMFVGCSQIVSLDLSTAEP